MPIPVQLLALLCYRFSVGLKATLSIPVNLISDTLCCIFLEVSVWTDSRGRTKKTTTVCSICQRLYRGHVFVQCLSFFCFLIFFLQCAKTFLNLMAHISKEQTVQYILTLNDDTLQVHRQTH